MGTIATPSLSASHAYTFQGLLQCLNLNPLYNDPRHGAHYVKLHKWYLFCMPAPPTPRNWRQNYSRYFASYVGRNCTYNLPHLCPVSNYGSVFLSNMEGECERLKETSHLPRQSNSTRLWDTEQIMSWTTVVNADETNQITLKHFMKTFIT